MALIGFEHVGMSVSDIDKSLGFYVDLLGMALVARRQGQGGGDLCFLSAGNAMLEIAAPAAGAVPAEDVADGQAGLRHLTFAFDDIDDICARLERAGVAMVAPPRAAHNRDIIDKVAFCRDPDGILIELCQR
jgi:glyoxylase I family protein